MPSQVSSRHSGWRYDPDNTRLICYIRGTAVLLVDDATADITLNNSNGLSGFGGATGVAMTDDALLALGTGDDQVMLLRSTELLTGVELANVIVGSSVVGTIPANSLIMSNITASGDFVFVAQTGGDSIEYFRADANVQEFVVNFESNDINFRVESEGNANAIFVDAGNDRVGIMNGAPGVALDVTGAVTSSGIFSADEWQTTGGGTATQSTDKSAAFTLNGTTGIITMNNSSLGAGDESVAVWSNSSITATSTVVVCHAATGAGNAESYAILVGAVASGQCELVVSNLTGGALTDAIQVNFVVFGGASS